MIGWRVDFSDGFLLGCFSFSRFYRVSNSVGISAYSLLDLLGAQRNIKAKQADPSELNSMPQKDNMIQRLNKKKGFSFTFYSLFLLIKGKIYRLDHIETRIYTKIHLPSFDLVYVCMYLSTRIASRSRSGPCT